MGVVSSQSDCLSITEPPSVTQAHEPPALELMVDSGDMHVSQQAPFADTRGNLNPTPHCKAALRPGACAHAVCVARPPPTISPQTHAHLSERRAPALMSSPPLAASAPAMSRANLDM